MIQLLTQETLGHREIDLQNYTSNTIELGNPRPKYSTIY